MKKRWRSFLLTFAVIVCVLSAAFAAYSWSRQNAQRKRDLGYQLALQKYRRDLRSAATRSDVERYLQSRNIQFRQLCCVDNEPSGFSDFVLVGKEEVPWYCSENNVYIAFQFDGTERRAFYQYSPPRAGSDRLKAITIYQKLDNCL